MREISWLSAGRVTTGSITKLETDNCPGAWLVDFISVRTNDFRLSDLYRFLIPNSRISFNGCPIFGVQTRGYQNLHGPPLGERRGVTYAFFPVQTPY